MAEIKIDYSREFFDKDFPKREAYLRAWQYAKPYRFRLIVGIICGFLTAGTLVPLFQIVQPAASSMEAKIQKVIAVEGETAKDVVAAPTPAQKPSEVSKLPSWYPKVEKTARKFGITLMDDRGVMQGAMILIALIVIPLVALVRLALKYLNHYTFSWVDAHIAADVSCDLIKHVQCQSLEFFSRVNVGQLFSRIIFDPAQMCSVIETVIADLAEAPFEIMVSIGFVIWYAIQNDMLATLVVIALAFPLFMFPLQTIAKKIKEWQRKTMERSSGVFSRLQEVISCIRLVKASDMADAEYRTYCAANEFMIKATMRSIRIGALVPFVMEFVGVALMCGFVCWCYYKNITIADVLPMLAPLLAVYKPIKRLSKLLVSVETGMAALNRIFSLQDVEMRLPEAKNPSPKKSFDEKIIFDNVSYRYFTAERDAVHSASFEIRRGQKVAVVGGTGSGKSTLGSLLARFADPKSGRVLIDGKDVRDISSDDLRSLIGVVTQDALLFNEPLEYNIRYGTFGANEDEVVKAAKLANAHDFILSQPEGYKRLAGEKGFSLSGGERQRIAIARAVLKNPPILILDEATSALDTITERQVQEAIEKLMENRTTFVIAHRLSTIRDADMILVMQDGEIVERGTHDELYQKGGVYRSLCDMQKAA